MNKDTLAFDFNPVNKRLNILTVVKTDLILEVYAHVQAEELFDLQLFKDYVIGLSRVRLGEAWGRFSYQLPGNFNFNPESMISQGEKLIESVVNTVKGQSQVSWFIMHR
jgi:hypothetical protein